MPRTNKFRAVKTTVDNITFASKKEAARYIELKSLLRARKISKLRLQVVYQITINGIKVCKYIADFVYVEKGVEVVEDVKGFKTQVYRLKNKLMKAALGIEVREV